uniref:Protein-lysine N-methyltransferase SMYD4 n=1 Tax=Culicoides sonorensis TaxID=179676 RepID=A0A336KY89_CULSO
MPILDESIENACLHIRRQTPDNIFAQINTKCVTYEKKFEIINEIKGIKYIEKFVTKKLNKDINFALECKEYGNKEFKAGRFNRSLELYSRSILNTPPNTSELATVLGNRSAVLFNLKEYEASVNDINAALDKFPKENIFKLIHRKAKCLFELQKFEEAYVNFITSEFLIQENDKIPSSQKTCLLFDIKLMINYIKRNSTPFVNKICTNLDSHTLNGISNSLKVNDFLEIAYNKLEGRHAVCRQKIEAGDLLLQESPYASVLAEAFCLSHCQNCFKRTTVPIACDNCRDVIFCSQNCKGEGMNFHQFECGLLKSIWKCKSNLATHLSIRLITSKDPESLITNRNIKHLNGNENGESIKSGNSNSNGHVDDNFSKLYSLLTHEKEFSKEKIFEFMLMAKFQLECLKVGGYLENKYLAYENYFASLLYQNILILHFNAHEIFELQKDNQQDPGKTVCIGAAIYPFLAQFNHSCDPTTVRYFDGNRVIIRATRNIYPNEQISENYGPIFTQEPQQERKLQLKEKYKFECQCDACSNNWPLLKEMQDKSVPIKCQGNNGNCGTILTCNEKITKIHCSKCKHETDVLSIIKFLQTLDTKLEMGKKLFESNQINDALNTYLDLIKDMDQQIKPPFSKWHICQKRIRSVYLELGNKINFNLAQNKTTTNYFM